MIGFADFLQEPIAGEFELVAENLTELRTMIKELQEVHAHEQVDEKKAKVLLYFAVFHAHYRSITSVKVFQKYFTFTFHWVFYPEKSFM